jgi:carbamoyltransferase
MYTLGINATYHDSSACIVKDGIVIAAAEDERFTGIKHGKRPIPFSTYELPFHAIDYCLKEAGIYLHELDHIAYAFDPNLFSNIHLEGDSITLPINPKIAEKDLPPGKSVWDPLFVLSIVNAPDHLRDGYPHHLQQRFHNSRIRSTYKWHFVDHHIGHAASAFFPSPFEKAAVMTLDGRGERVTTGYYKGDGYSLEPIGEVTMPNSFGILYERITTHLGFLHSSDEYKVMALASYGKPTYVDQFREIVKLADDGTYTVADVNLEDYFGPKRLRGTAFTEKHFDIAHSLQKVLEESVQELTYWLYEKTGMENLCLAGGVALNCVMNARIRDNGPFKKIWVQPAAGDAGTSLGAALWIDNQERAKKNEGKRIYAMEHAYLGPQYSDDEIENFLKWSKVPYRRMDDVSKETAEILMQDKVIGWFQGRMEFGPRALGARSILASPIHAEMQAKLNEIKDREDFRPVAPVVLEEKADNWFINAGVSPFMLFVYDVDPAKKHLIPAVTHVDGTARIQTIRRDQNQRYYDLIKTFEQKTGVPILINTSFNTRGKPIVCSPRDAVECFWTSPLDALVIGSFVLEKEKHHDPNFSGRSNLQSAGLA